MKAYLTNIKRETFNETLKANLHFVLSLTNNPSFMYWARMEMIDLFSLMERNLEQSFITLDTIDIAVQIHHNLLLNTDYALTFLTDPQR